MLDVSDQFKTAVYDINDRRVTAKVTFDISDVTAHDDASVDVSSDAIISHKDQTTNQKRDRPAYATFEPDYWRLDGSFVLPPKADEVGHEVGWYSGDFIDESIQWINFYFTEPHSSIGLSITFDVPANEYATEFSIVALDASDTPIMWESVTGNDKSLYVMEIPIYEYKTIGITVTKWSKPNRRAKITEVSFGVVREYNDDNIIKINLLEEINTTSATVPSNELKFTVDNSNKEFNILNPTGIYKYLQERQAVELEIGVEVLQDVYEWVSMGQYFLSDWQSDEGSLTTTFTARNRIDFLPHIEIENLTPMSTNLYDLAVNLLNDIGVRRYSIDSALQSIQTQSIYKKTTPRRLLQMIAIAGQCVMYVDRDDTLHLKRLDNDVPVDYLSFDNIYREPKINLENLVSRVEVDYYTNGDSAGTYTESNNVDGGSALKVENTLVNSLSHARIVAEWIMSEANQRALYDVNWRQNPALECGDIVEIEDTFGGEKESRIIRQEFEYAGYLRGKTKTKGRI